MITSTGFVSGSMVTLLLSVGLFMAYSGLSTIFFGSVSLFTASFFGTSVVLIDLSVSFSSLRADNGGMSMCFVSYSLRFISYLFSFMLLLFFFGSYVGSWSVDVLPFAAFVWLSCYFFLDSFFTSSVRVFLVFTGTFASM